jgi:hypothetical protein
MSSHLDQTIADLQEEVRLREAEIIHTKRMVNSLCIRAQRSPVYPDSELEQQRQIGSIRSDLFYGRPLGACVREILEMRKASNQGAAPIEDIMSALSKGGYALDQITKDTDGQKRGVAISLAKNSRDFHRLPNGNWGLASWYPNVKKSKEEVTSNGNGSKKEEAKPATADETETPHEEEVKF